MKYIRTKCRAIIKSNRNSINMETISTIIKTTAVSLLNHAGCIWMNQTTKLNTVGNEYIQTIKLLSPHIPHLSTASLLHFHGHQHFDHIHDQLNIKAFSKIIRTNTNNGINQQLAQIYRQWKNAKIDTNLCSMKKIQSRH